VSVLTLPEPQGWASSGRRLLLVTVAGLAPAVAALGFALRALIRGSFLTALVMCALGASFVLVVVALQFVRRGSTTPRAEHDSTGILLLPDRRFSVLVVVSLLLVTLSMLAISVAVPMGALDIPMSGGMRTFSPLVAGFGALVGLAGLFTGWRRGGVGYVGLSPDGVDIANIISTESVDWDEIVQVTDTVQGKKTRKAVVLQMRDGSEKVIDGADLYAPGGATLYWMVRHYWLLAEDRTELGDGRALERMSDGRFATA
jgi:hypothetical protein